MAGREESMRDKIKEDIARISKTVEKLASPELSQASEWVSTTARAQLVGQFYTGLESCFEKILKLLACPVTSGNEQFHKELLLAAGKAELFLSEHEVLLKDLLGFRHFSRHGYGMDLRGEEIQAKALLIEKAWPSLKTNLESKTGCL